MAHGICSGADRDGGFGEPVFHQLLVAGRTTWIDLLLSASGRRARHRDGVETIRTSSGSPRLWSGRAWHPGNLDPRPEGYGAVELGARVRLCVRHHPRAASDRLGASQTRAGGRKLDPCVSAVGVVSPASDVPVSGPAVADLAACLLIGCGGGGSGVPDGFDPLRRRRAAGVTPVDRCLDRQYSRDGSGRCLSVTDADRDRCRGGLLCRGGTAAREALAGKDGTRRASGNLAGTCGEAVAGLRRGAAIPAADHDGDASPIGRAFGGVRSGTWIGGADDRVGARAAPRFGGHRGDGSDDGA